MKEKKTILALDPGTQVTGWALVRGGKVVDAGSVTARGRQLGQRLDMIFAQVCLLIEDHKPDMVAVEAADEVFGRNRRRALASLARLIGGIEALCSVSGIPVTRVNPQTWQQAMLRCGPRALRKGRKQAAARIAKALTGMDLGEDAADAALIGHYVARGGQA